jgi:hypothetical protein
MTRTTTMITLTSTSLLAVLAAAAISGCQAPDLSPPTGQVDPYPAPANDPRFAVLDATLRHWLGVHEPVVVQDGVHPLQVQAPVRNLAERRLGWEFQVLEPKQTVRLTRSAMDVEAMDYRVEVKWGK